MWTILKHSNHILFTYAQYEITTTYVNSLVIVRKESREKKNRQ